MTRKHYFITFLTFALVASPLCVAIGAQNVINAGTKISGRSQNILISANCENKYNSCMDTFCVMDNFSGGRCVCSDKYSQYATEEEKINDTEIKNSKLAALGDATLKLPISARDKKTRGVDLSLWETNNDTDDETSGPDTQTGDGIFASAHTQCAERIPDCDAQMDLLRTAYAQNIRADCIAYENALKQRKTANLQKQVETQSTLRRAALAQYRDANKYDLGQCTTLFSECMMTTAGCGDDFTGCVDVMASAPQMHDIAGATTSVSIYETTFEILDSKRPMCETVTKQCQDVAQNVWTTFLRAVAPQLKFAEIRAEDNVRQSCIDNVSKCFANACHDHIDEKTPDSYDMCLTRPGTMLSFCKNELNACGIDTATPDTAENSQIWNSVVARLAAMRVNSCTDAVKECLTDADRCGPDWSNCVGLSTDTIIRMCPYDKLVGCQKFYGDKKIYDDAVYDELSDMIQGTVAEIDNKLLEHCDTALTQSMINTCGSDKNCNDTIVGEDIGAEQLQYGICLFEMQGDNIDIKWDYCFRNAESIPDALLGAKDLGNGPFIAPLTGVILGTIYWENISVDSDGNLTTVDEYLRKINASEMRPESREIVATELQKLQANIDNTIKAIEQDTTVSACMTGRNLANLPQFEKRGNARFPNLTKNMRRIIAQSALNQAKENYYKKYDAINEQIVKDFNNINQRISKNTDNKKYAQIKEMAGQSCEAFAEMSGMSKTERPRSKIGAVIVTVVAVIVSIVVTIFTFGAGAVTIAAALELGGLVGAVTFGTYMAADAIAAKVDSAIDRKTQHTYSSGHYRVENWNYKESINTEFDPATMTCKRCIKTKHCAESHDPIFGKWKCKKWAEPTETCTDIQF